jgi:hypothetical protein
MSHAPLRAATGTHCSLKRRMARGGLTMRDEAVASSGPNPLLSALVAVALLALVGTLMAFAILNYKNADDALKIWSALSGFTGLIVGAVATYFFTSGAIRSAEQRAARASNVATANQVALTQVAGLMNPDEWKRIRIDPMIAPAVQAETMPPPSAE